MKPGARERMRHLPLLVFIPLACALFTGCFGSSSTASSDGGFELDTSFSIETGTEAAAHHDAGPGDATLPEAGPSDAAPDGSEAGPSGLFSTAPVDFGLADCGGKPSPAARSYGFQNDGPVAITWSASVAGPVFALQGATSGSVSPGASGSITVGVIGVPATSTAGTAITDTL